ncbi:glyoxylase-like metal-dependent hydrolase (beta-lactamase superfamily II) [Flavobacterium cutihirudinis]|uniref:Glyoxylase-like metal-dependent hydrolase (Beta-lactamase superfamily II) n=1 Tax=Flavobacterium cutihirudinis TaxID=1265740 RepID=A0A3D9FWV9_9FLAO|nr:MBL fold metallo-hydrolase [Flavobacterium cutihirudinis]RED25269.1 glyoxylase-like metal-dependent hydrolase (beta-lactamase superfamily II) [Flavobacterium cutihirudinis]
MKNIAKDVYQIPLFPRNAINCYVIEDVLIDAGIRSSSGIILKALKGKSITKHVLTHAHADHQGSTKIICETLNIPLLCSKPEKTAAENGNVIFEYPNPNHIISKFQKNFWAGKGHPVSETLKEGDKIGGFTVIETPGHSSGHLSFFRESDGLLIVGDVMTNMNLLTTKVGLHEPPHLFTSDKETNRKSILKLAALKPKTLCFGHGPVLKNNGEFEHFVRKLKPHY